MMGSNPRYLLKKFHNLLFISLIFNYKSIQDVVTKNVSVVTVIIRKRKKCVDQMVKTIITHVRQDVQEW